MNFNGLTQKYLELSRTSVVYSIKSLNNVEKFRKKAKADRETAEKLQNFIEERKLNDKTPKDHLEILMESCLQTASVHEEMANALKREAKVIKQDGLMYSKVVANMKQLDQAANKRPNK